MLSATAAVPLAFLTPSMTQILIILFVLLLLFGRRLPEIGRSLGKGLVEFKKGLRGVEDEIRQIDVEATHPSATPPQSAPLNPGPAARLPNAPSPAMPQGYAPVAPGAVPSYMPSQGAPMAAPMAPMAPMTGMPLAPMAPTSPMAAAPMAGEPIRQAQIVCPRCSHMMPAGSRFCSDCGQPIAS